PGLNTTRSDTAVPRFVPVVTTIDVTPAPYAALENTTCWGVSSSNQLNCGSVVGSSSIRLKKAVSGAGFGCRKSMVSRQFCGRSPLGSSTLIFYSLDVSTEHGPYLHPIGMRRSWSLRTPPKLDQGLPAGCPYVRPRCRERLSGDSRISRRVHRRVTATSPPTRNRCPGGPKSP